MRRKKSKFYVINFIEPLIISLKKKILKQRAMEAHIQILCKEDKSDGRGEMCARTLNETEQYSLRYIDFL